MREGGRVGIRRNTQGSRREVRQAVCVCIPPSAAASSRGDKTYLSVDLGLYQSLLFVRGRGRACMPLKGRKLLPLLVVRVAAAVATADTVATAAVD